MESSVNIEEYYFTTVNNIILFLCHEKGRLCFIVNDDSDPGIKQGPNTQNKAVVIKQNEKRNRSNVSYNFLQTDVF